MTRKKVLILAGLGAAVILAVAALRWKDLLIRYHVIRLSGNPALQEEFLEKSENSIEGLALRDFYRERPFELARKLINLVEISADPPCRLWNNLENMRKGTVALNKFLLLGDGISSCRYWFQDADLKGGASGFGFFDINETNLQGRLNVLWDLLKTLEGRTFEYKGHRFRIVRGKNGAAESTGLEFERGDLVIPELEISSGPAIWTGEELLVLGKPCGAALNPVTGRWRGIRGNPRTSCGPDCTLWLGQGKVLVASMAGEREMVFDHYLVAHDRWKEQGGVNLRFMGYPTKRSPNAEISILGGVTVGEDAIVFVHSNTDDDFSVRGSRMDPSGRARPISVKGAPRGLYGGPAIHAVGSRVFFWGYGSLLENRGNIWDAKRDAWEKLPQTEESAHPRYSFGHCRIGKEIVIFGGACGSGVASIIGNGLIYSMEKNRWGPLPVQAQIAGRRDFLMLAAGKEVLIWGGEISGNRNTLPYKRSNSGILLDPLSGASGTFPLEVGPGSRRPSICVWTGKEILLVGGSRGVRYFHDTWAFNPETSRWRQLDDFPLFRSQAKASDVAR